MWVPTDRNLYRLLTDWGGVIAGILALAAAWWTVKVTAAQTATTVRLEREHVASEDRAFCVMLEAAMARVLAEAAWGKTTFPQILTQTNGSSREAFVVRTCITKGAFAELRTACVRLGSPLTGEFLDLEREIDSFAAQWEEQLTNASVMIRKGKHAGLGEQLASIEASATELRKKAAEGAA